MIRSPHPSERPRRARSVRGAGLASALSVLLTAVGQVADAQPTSSPDPDRARAEALFFDAKTRIDAGDFDGACPRFTESLSLLASASTAIHVARCHAHDGRLASAFDAYELALKLVGAVDPERAAAITKIAVDERDALRPRVPTIDLDLGATDVARANLEIAVDGAPLPRDRAPGPLMLDPGEHDVTIVAEGFQRQELHVEATAGKAERIEVRLVPLVSRPAAGGDPAPQKPPATPIREGSKPAWPWAVGAVGVAFLGVGLGFFIDSRVAAGGLSSCRAYGADELTICPADEYADVGAIEDDVDRANIGLGVGAPLAVAGMAGIIVAVVGLATSAREAAPSAFQVLPVPSPDGVGVAIVGMY